VPSICRLDLADEIIAVSDEDAYATTRKLARLEGIFGGITSGPMCSNIAGMHQARVLNVRIAQDIRGDAVRLYVTRSFTCHSRLVLSRSIPANMRDNSKAPHPALHIPQEIPLNVDRPVLLPSDRKQSSDLLVPMREFPATL
jgi:hypothetical protein